MAVSLGRCASSSRDDGLDLLPGNASPPSGLSVELLPDHRQHEGLLEPLEIGLRVEQPVGMIDPQADDVMPRGQVENQGVGGPEDLLAIGPERSQGVDVEEPAIVDLVPGHAPVGQAIGLGAKQGVEGVEAAADSPASPLSASSDRPIAGSDLGMLSMRAASRRLMTSFSRCRSAARSGSVSLCAGRLRIAVRMLWNSRTASWSAPSCAGDRLEGRLQDLPVAAWIERKPMLVILDVERRRPRAPGAVRPARAPRRRGRPGTAAGPCPRFSGRIGADQSMSKNPA